MNKFTIWGTLDRGYPEFLYITGKTKSLQHPLGTIYFRTDGFDPEYFTYNEDWMDEDTQVY